MSKWTPERLKKDRESWEAKNNSRTTNRTASTGTAAGTANTTDKWTPERIAKMQKWLLEHPIDHKYDEMCDMLDSPAPPEQLASRAAYEALKEIGKIPPGIE